MKKGIILIFLVGYLSAFAQSTANYQIKFLEVNKNNSDYGVAILDDNKLIFTSADELEDGKKKNYNPRKELFIGDIDFDGEIYNIKPVIKKENNKFNTTGIAYSKDFKTVYFSRNKYLRKRSKQKLRKNQRLELFKADVDSEGNWKNITKLPFNKDKFTTGFPVLSKDNKRLYFVSDRLPSQGATDIFYVDIKEDGTFGDPVNLGQNVNTSGNETTPFLSENNIMYFSSDGHPGQGNLDVYAVEIYDDSTSEAYHLASPINSINDDFAYIVNKENKQGFFTSNRLQGKGFNDLYSFILEEDVRPGECFILVDGKVKDTKTEEIIAGATVDLYDLNGELLESVTTFDDGTYKFTVSCANEYKLIASNENYKNDEKRIEILEENYHSALHTNLNLERIGGNKPAIKSLQPVYYDFDSAIITDAAAKEMDRVAEIMKENPDLIIEASAYSDSRGSDGYNLSLSKRRARAAVEYLKSQGIEEDRIRAKGYGEARLVNQCVNGVECDEEAHQLNRRTEFNFINIQASRNRLNILRKRTRLASTEKKVDKIKKAEPIKSKEKVPKQIPSIVNKETQQEYAENNSVKSKEKASIQETEIVEIKQTNNKALNYIEEEKAKMIDKYAALEMKFEMAAEEFNQSSDSLLAEKNKVIAYRKEIEESNEIGWSNIIEYKNRLISFNKKYRKFTQVKKSNGSIIIIGENDNTYKTNKSELAMVKIGDGMEIEQLRPLNNLISEDDELSEADMHDKEILEENLKVTSVQVIAMKVNARGKYSQTNNAKKTDLIKIKFRLLKNNNIASGPKEAHIVLENPNGKVAQAKGVFKIKETNQETKFTDSSIISYNKNDIDVVLYIQKKGKDYEKGIYPIKLFLEGHLVAVSNLNLQNTF